MLLRVQSGQPNPPRGYMHGLSLLGKVAIWNKTVTLCGQVFSLPVMSCRLASASSSMLHSVVNHYPSPPLHPGASLSLPAPRASSSVLSGSPELELRERYIHRCFSLVKTSQTCSYVPCLQCCLFNTFFSLKTVPKQVSQEKCPRKVWHRFCMSYREHFWKQSFTKREPPAALCNLTEEFGKIGHIHQKCALPFEKPWTSGELFLKYFQLFELLHWLRFIQSEGPLCGSLWFNLWGGWTLQIKARSTKDQNKVNKTSLGTIITILPQRNSSDIHNCLWSVLLQVKK